MEAREAIATFLASARGLDDSRAWGYFLDFLDLVESHREDLRGAQWPDDFPELEADTYRVMLIPLERDLRAFLSEVPLERDQDVNNRRTQELIGFVAGFFQRADAIVERLSGAQTH